MSWIAIFKHLAQLVWLAPALKHGPVPACRRASASGTVVAEGPAAGARPWAPPPVPWRALLTMIGLLGLLFGVLFYLALREGP